VPEVWQVAVGGTCFCIVLIVSIVLLAVSFSTLEPNEIGLRVDGVNIQLDRSTHTLASSKRSRSKIWIFFSLFVSPRSTTGVRHSVVSLLASFVPPIVAKLWENGRHFLGLGHYFVKFPTEVRETEVDVKARSVDGASVQAKCSFQWQIQKDLNKVLKLYSLFDEQYAKAFDKIANDEIRNVAASYTAFDFFFKRSEITVAMGQSLDRALSLVGVSVSGFQLLNFDVPKAFSATVQVTEETKQRKTRAESNQAKANITAQAKVETAKEDATVLRVQAEAAAIAFVQEKTAQRDSIAIRIGAERESYKAMKQNLTLTSAELLTIIWLGAVQTSPASQLVSIDVPRGVQP